MSENNNNAAKQFAAWEPVEGTILEETASIEYCGASFSVLRVRLADGAEIQISSSTIETPPVGWSFRAKAGYSLFSIEGFPYRQKPDSPLMPMLIDFEPLSPATVRSESNSFPTRPSNAEAPRMIEHTRTQLGGLNFDD